MRELPAAVAATPLGTNLVASAAKESERRPFVLRIAQLAETA